MRFLLGITGTMGSGKSTAGKYLAEKYGFEIMRVSGKMREIADELGIKPSREFLQGIGKFMRDFDDDVWIRYLVKKIKLNTIGSIVVDDIRRINEIEHLKPLGFKFIRIKTSAKKRKTRIETRDKNIISLDDWEKWSEHLTENQVHNISTDFIITNDGSLNDLRKQLDIILEELGYDSTAK